MSGRLFDSDTRLDSIKNQQKKEIILNTTSFNIVNDSAPKRSNSAFRENPSFTQINYERFLPLSLKELTPIKKILINSRDVLSYSLILRN